MNILHTTSSLRPSAGGPARSVPQLALAQTECGHQVSIWANEQSQHRFADEVLNVGSVAICQGSLEGLFDSGGQFSLVHDHGIWEPFHSKVANLCRRNGIPRVVSPRGMLEPWSLDHKKWKKRLAWHLYQRRNLMDSDLLHATAEQEKAQFRCLGLENPVIVQPNGVQLPTDIDFSDLSTLPTATSGERIMLYVGRVHPKKGLPLALAAWANLAPVGWKMHVVGPDEVGHVAELKALAERKCVERDWCFDGPLEGQAKWRAFERADVVILPTYSENFGITVAESLACGTPVITTTGTPWSGLVERKCGWWVEPEVESIMIAMRKAMCLDRAKLKDMGDIGRRWVASDFSWPSIASAMLEGYKTLIEQKTL